MTPPNAAPSIDPTDVARFDRLAATWWDPAGPMRALHKFNPTRVGYLRDLLSGHFGHPPGAAPLAGLRVLDIGCGAGLLSEPLARLGATMTAIDPAGANIDVARRHAAGGGLAIDYRNITLEALAQDASHFDVVLAMEVVEHVRDVKSFLKLAGGLVKPGGLLVAATLNRTFKSYALAIVGAEYVLGWVPKGTHRWEQFVTPEELTRALRGAGLDVIDRTGVTYDPLGDRWRLARDMAVNYILAATRAA